MEEGEDGSGDSALKTMEDELMTPTGPSPSSFPPPPPPLSKKEGSCTECSAPAVIGLHTATFSVVAPQTLKVLRLLFSVFFSQCFILSVLFSVFRVENDLQ